MIFSNRALSIMFGATLIFSALFPEGAIAQSQERSEIFPLSDFLENNTQQSELEKQVDAVAGIRKFADSLPAVANELVYSGRSVRDFRQLPSGDIAVKLGSEAGWAVAGSILGNLAPNTISADLEERLDLESAKVGIRFDVHGPISETGIVRIRQIEGRLWAPEEIQDWLTETGIRKLLLEVEAEPLVVLQDDQHGVFFSEENQWSFSNQGALEANQPATIDADADIAEALALYQNPRFAHDKGVVVAVIDSGANLGVPTLSGGFWENPIEIPNNNFDDDGNGLVDDVHGWDFVRASGAINDHAGGDGHGTAVAGAIIAHRAGYQLISGTAPDAKAMILNVSKGGSEVDVFAIIQALEYSISKNVDIINMSFSTEAYSQLLFKTIVRASNQGILLVASAGNDNVNVLSNPTYPCVFDRVICVGSSTATDEKALHSNFGAEVPNRPIGVTMAAPGERLLLVSARGNLFIGSGTSYAAPLVSGTLAMLRAARPQESTQMTRARLLNGADQLRTLRNYFGYNSPNHKTGRRLNSYRALFLPKQGIADPNYCAQKRDDGYPRHLNYPYANFGDLGIDGSSFDKAFTICTKRQLLSLREADRAKHFKLQRDVFWDEKTHLGGQSMIGQNWSNPFDGKFYGQGFSIFNIEENVQYSWGLFRHLGPNSAVVSINLRQLNVKSGGPSGAMSPIGEGLLNFVQVEGHLQSIGNVGGLLGESNGSRTLNSFFEGSVVSSDGNVGGIAGVLMSGAIVKKSGSRVDVRGKLAGGIAGLSQTGTRIENVFAFGNICGELFAGGITARAGDSVIRNVLSSGRVHCGQAAGIVLEIMNSLVENSYSISVVDPSLNGGGAIGVISDTPSVLASCVAGNCGPKNALRAPSRVVSVFYLNRLATPAGAAGEGKGFVELLERSTFKGWSFGGDWTAPSLKPEIPRVLRIPRSVGACNPDL